MCKECSVQRKADLMHGLTLALKDLVPPFPLAVRTPLGDATLSYQNSVNRRYDSWGNST